MLDVHARTVGPPRPVAVAILLDADVLGLLPSFPCFMLYPGCQTSLQIGDACVLLLAGAGTDVMLATSCATVFVDGLAIDRGLVSRPTLVFVTACYRCQSLLTAMGSMTADRVALLQRFAPGGCSFVDDEECGMLGVYPVVGHCARLGWI